MPEKVSRESEEEGDGHDMSLNLGDQAITLSLESSLFIISLLGFLISILNPFTTSGKLGLVGIMLLFFLASLLISSFYFLYLYLKKKDSDGRDKLIVFSVPIFLLITTFFILQSTSIPLGGWAIGTSNPLIARDYVAFSMVSGILLLASGTIILLNDISDILVRHKMVKVSAGLVLALTFSTMLLHLVPAHTMGEQGYGWTGKYLSALDPYYYYRHAKTIAKTGFIPEVDDLTYPTDPISFASSRFMVSVLMGSIATLLEPIGITVHDVAMVYPGVFAAFTVLVLYLLLRDLFSDMKPYNYAVALLGAFMLMLSYAFASKAIASNCEDDTLGMFLLVSSFLLFVISLRRRSYLFSILSGFSFLLLNMSWSGYSYGLMILGVFAAFYAVTNFIHKKNCIEHLPYYIIPFFMAHLAPLILHECGGPPVFAMPNNLILLPFGVAIALSFTLEAIRVAMYGKTEVKGKGIEDRVENIVEQNIYLISGLIVVASIVSLLVLVGGPERVIGYVINTLEGAKVGDIIGKTTAEQNPLCGGLKGNILERAYHILQRGCLLAFYNSFGIGYWFSLIMIPVLLYFILKKRSLGAVFLLSWALPMIWGVANKSQYQFTASVPIVALGATIGLIMAMKREDWESLRVIPTLILLAVILLLPMLQAISPVSVSPVIIGPFGGLSAIHAGLGVSERIYWDETLKWIGKQPEDTTVLTWWDYGHWIAAISERTSIADNTKGRPFIVQDLARFHVLVENETEALEIAKKYNSTNVVIDYTMIGKSGAPHFIATSGLGGYIPPKQMSVECSDGRNCDHLVDDEMEGYASVYIGGNQSGSILIDLGGIYVINRTEMHLWDLDGRYYQYKIEVSTDAVNWQEVVDKTDGEWRGLQADSFSDVNAALVKITGTYASVENEFRVLGVRIYNPKYDGSYAGYGQCLPILGGGCQFYRGRNKDVCDKFLINRRNLKESWASDDGGGFDKVRTIVFECNSYIVGLIFNIKNDRISSVEVVDDRLDTISWKNWQDLHHDSVLGIQPLIGNKTDMGVLKNIVTYADNPQNYVDFPTFKLLVYVPEEFNNYMMTRLYLGDYMDEYKEFGLCDPSVRKLEHFKLVGEFRGDLKSYYSGADSSHLGYVRAYEIDYSGAEQ